MTFLNGCISPVVGHPSTTQQPASHLLACLSRCLGEPAGECQRILGANSRYLEAVERFLNAPQSQACLNRHVASFQFAQKDQLDFLDRHDRRSRLIASYHAGDFIYGANVYANHESSAISQFVLLQHKPGKNFQRNLDLAFGKQQTKQRIPLQLESFNYLGFRKTLRTRRTSLLIFADLPFGFGIRVLTIGRATARTPFHQQAGSLPTEALWVYCAALPAGALNTESFSNPASTQSVPARCSEISGRKAASCLLALTGEKKKRFGAAIYWLFANLRRRGLAHEVPGADRG